MLQIISNMIHRAGLAGAIRTTWPLCWTPLFPGAQAPFPGPNNSSQTWGGGWQTWGGGWQRMLGGGPGQTLEGLVFPGPHKVLKAQTTFFHPAVVFNYT